MNTDAMLTELYTRKQRLEKNGKNSEGVGVLRKIERQIRNIKKQQ